MVLLCLGILRNLALKVCAVLLHHPALPMLSHPTVDCRRRRPLFHTHTPSAHTRAHLCPHIWLQVGQLVVITPVTSRTRCLLACILIVLRFDPHPSERSAVCLPRFVAPVCWFFERVGKCNSARRNVHVHTNMNMHMQKHMSNTGNMQRSTTRHMQMCTKHDCTQQNIIIGERSGEDRRNNK